MDNRGLAGAFMFVGGLQFAIGMVLAEIFYPGYNVSGNYISDLGATCRETCTIYQPSAFIFNTSAIFLGILILLSSYCLWLEFKDYLISILIGLSGLGALGVGLFPETAGILHLIVSLITFLFAALSAIAARNFVKSPFYFFLSVPGDRKLGSTCFIRIGILYGAWPRRNGKDDRLSCPPLGDRVWGIFDEQ